MLDRLKIIDALRSAGVERGDTVMVHSSFKSLGVVDGGPQTVVDAFVDSVGALGCVMFPTFNFQAWPHEQVFNYKETPSHMGIITEFARKDSRFSRTMHPIYSFAEYPDWMPCWHVCFCAFGPGSAFDRFCQRDGKIVSIGVFGNSFTLIHRAEELAGLPEADYWREPKFWTGEYVFHSTKMQMSWGMTVRKKGVRTAVNPAIEELIRQGIVRPFRMGEAECHITDSPPFVGGIIKIARERPELLREWES